MDTASGQTLREYVWLDGTPLAYVTAGEVYHVHSDHLGTPQMLTDSAGGIAWRGDYSPFGQAATTGSVTFNLRFPGQYFDAETGLHYNWHRYYDPETGRYITSDPIGLAGGLNTYAYVGGNPLLYSDPAGLDWQLTIGIGGSIRGHPIPILPGPWLGGGLVLGFTSSGQLIIQVQASGSLGPGAGAFIGLEGSIARTDCPTVAGISIQRALRTDFNIGAGPSVGGSVQYDREGGGGITAGVGKVGGGYGVQLSGGMAQTVTIATPPIFGNQEISCGCQ